MSTQRQDPAPQEDLKLLHFPSTNTAAHRAAPNDVARLSELLDDTVWAFSNCRVDAAGQPVAEVDWLFYNTTRGDFTVSEWKHFSSPVAAVTDTGRPWVLTDGTEAANPIEQVARQLDAVRAVLRKAVRPRFFLQVEALDLNPQQCVYAPQIGPDATRERIRYGRVHGTLEDLAASLVESRKVPAPLLVSDPSQLMGLADTLANLFRCSVSRSVRRKLTVGQPDPASDAAERIVEIHLQLSLLHAELARLMRPQPAEPSPVTSPAKTNLPKNVTGSAVPAQGAVATKQAAKVAKGVEMRLMKAHLDRHLKGVGNEPEALVQGLSRAWAAALKDPRMRRGGAVNQTVFGQAATARTSHLGPLRQLLGNSVPLWCLEQARDIGLDARTDPKRSSHLLLGRI